MPTLDNDSQAPPRRPVLAPIACPNDHQTNDDDVLNHFALYTNIPGDDTIGHLTVNLTSPPGAANDAHYFNIDTGATTYILRDKE